MPLACGRDEPGVPVKTPGVATPKAMGSRRHVQDPGGAPPAHAAVEARVNDAVDAAPAAGRFGRRDPDATVGREPQREPEPERPAESLRGPWALESKPFGGRIDQLPRLGLNVADDELDRRPMAIRNPATVLPGGL